MSFLVERAVHHPPAWTGRKQDRALLTRLAPQAEGNGLWAAALILVEASQRPAAARVVEYLAWALLWFFHPRRLATLSVGVGQLQLRHWASLGMTGGCRPSLRNFLRVTSPKWNHYAIQAYLRRSLGNTEWTTRSVSLAYAGEARSYYMAELTRALESLHRARATSWRACRRGG